MPSLRPFLFLSVCLCIVLVAVDSLAIRVCQNKDCCKGFKGQSSLPRLLRDLEVDQVDTSGCLSLCNKGPNLHVVIAREDNNEQYVHQVTDPITAIVAVETIYGPQHVKIKAAVRCMEEGQKATTLQEQEKQFGSVIKVLQDDPALSQSIALVHALALRAAARCEAKEYQTALEDVQQGLDRLKNGSSSKDQELLSKLYRTQADAFEGLGRIKDAIESLQLWAASDPAFQSKIIKEIQRLNAMML